MEFRPSHWGATCWGATVLLAAILLAAGGCEPTPEVRHYRVERIKLTEPEPVDGMLAAIVPYQERAWYFKLTGPATATAKQAEAFHKFIQSIQFEDDKPKYEAPAAWHSLGSSGMRYETFEIPLTDGEHGKPLELTVTTLPKPSGDEASFLLSNINRWRGQLGLRPIEAEHLAKESASIPLKGTTATLVSLVGKLKSGGGMSPPFAGAPNGQ